MGRRLLKIPIWSERILWTTMMIMTMMIVVVWDAICKDWCFRCAYCLHHEAMALKKLRKDLWQDCCLTEIALHELLGTRRRVVPFGTSCDKPWVPVLWKWCSLFGSIRNCKPIEKFSGYQPCQMVKWRKNQRFKDHLCLRLRGTDLSNG
jgi:hypothetical protein